MKICIIHGQNHKGSTYHMGRLLIDRLPGEQDVTEFFLPRDLNHFCLGCYSCLNGDENCPYYAEKRAIMEAVEQASLLIFTTPKYCLGPSAAMKAFMDLTFTYWMTHRPRACMFQKRAVVLSTSAGAGNKGPIAMVKNALIYWGVPEVKGYGARVAAMNWEGVAGKTKQKIERDITKLAKAVSRPGKPRVGIKTRFLFFMMGGMQKAGWGSAPLEKVYWEENGWLGKKRPWKQA
ncbi:MAG: NAD(P)H-dependent oxidoreductase [Eubacteriales bacterium]|nr:NAD(P)H-dependent oxidoreductase [Eubacteriales bacterium]